MTSTSHQTHSGTHTSTQFDQIAMLEAQEQDRIQTEMRAMEKERIEMGDSMQKKIDQAEQELRDSARTELKKYMEEECRSLLESSELDGRKACDALDSTFTRNAPAIAKELTETFLASDHFSSTD